jgi:hypothetical protein
MTAFARTLAVDAPILFRAPIFDQEPVRRFEANHAGDLDFGHGRTSA